MSNFKKGDLVTPAPVSGFTKPPVGLVIKIGKQPDGKTHHILWVDSGGCFEAWHYENGIVPYTNREMVNNEEET